MEYLIRPVQCGDHKSVIALLQQLSLYQPDIHDMSDIWSNFISQPQTIALVAVSNSTTGGCVVGYGSVNLELKIRGGTQGHIEDIVVDSSWRGGGVGRSLVAALVQSAKSRDCYKLSLESREHNREFYEALGFSATGVALSMILTN